jgi:hypothetical protein
MVRQTIFLFIRALIIGILLNLGVQQVSETNSNLSQRELRTPQQIHSAVDQSSSRVSSHLPDIDN